jgi:hypothetical protein
MWDFATLADRLRDALAAAEDELRLEQAVYGLDRLDERKIQALLAGRLVPAYDVTREVHYPSTRGRKLSHRARCDLVLSPAGAPLRLDSAPPTLFDPARLCEPTDALWLEVKVAYQFREGGVRHTRYGAQWRQAVVDDLRKIEAEPLIRHAGLVLVVFNESQDVLAKDLELFEDVLARKEVLAGFASPQRCDRRAHRPPPVHRGRLADRAALEQRHNGSARFRAGVAHSLHCYISTQPTGRPCGV